MTDFADIWPMVIRLVLAAVLGGVVGWEREVHERPAGLRTHVLVCMGAALITLISLSFTKPPSDPARIAAQIVSGIGFLGAGTILRQGNIVRGLTTAASLWIVSGIGMAIGVGGPFMFLATFATLIVFLTLSTMSRLESTLGKKNIRRLRVELPTHGVSTLTTILHELTSMGLALQTMSVHHSHDPETRVVEMKLCVPRKVKLESITDLLAKQTDLGRIEWI